MKTEFQIALDHTLKWEGGYVNDPDDPGGATNFGVSLRTLKSLGELKDYDYDGDGDVDADDVRVMTREDAIDFYIFHFWNERYNELPVDIAVKLFDFSVNMGVAQAVKLLQEVIAVSKDGLYGPRTHERLMDLPEVIVLELYKSRVAYFYFKLADRRKTSRKYLYGWLRRCYS